MKKTVKILCIFMIAVLVLIMVINNNANAETTASLTSIASVNAGDKFDVKFSLNNGSAKIMYLYIKYDNSLFEFTGFEEQKNLSVNEYDDGRLSVYYFGDLAEESGESTSINYVTIHFKAKNDNITEDKTGKIEVEDGSDFSIVLAEDDANMSYNNMQANGSKFSAEITVKAKKDEPEKNAPVLDVDNISLKVGEVKKVSVTNGVAVTWTSSNGAVATVDENGNIKGIGVGEAIITASGNNETANVTVKVYEQNEENAPNLSENNVSIKKGETKQVTADKNVTWASSDENIATVDQNGNITGKSAGTATIIATDSNGKKAYVTVNVSESQQNDQNNNQNNNQGQGNNQDNGQSNDQGNNQGNNQNNNKNNGNQGSSNSNQSQGAQSQQSTTNTTATRNSSSSANEVVPATGENSVGTLAIFIIATLIVASVIFKNKSKLK